MNWLETIFGLSPDGGNGMTEAALVLGVALVIGVALAARRRRRLFNRWRPK